MCDGSRNHRRARQQSVGHLAGKRIRGAPDNFPLQTVLRGQSLGMALLGKGILLGA